MGQVTQEIYNEVEQFVNDREAMIISDLAEAFDLNYSKNPVEYRQYLGIKVTNIVECKDHFCEVHAIVEYSEGYLANTSDGPWPSDRSDEVIIHFFVDKDEKGELQISYHLDRNGKIDKELTFWDPNEDL